MKLLEERIRKDGIVKPGNVLKVDSFLNHQMDIELFSEMGKEFKRLYQLYLQRRLRALILTVMFILQRFSLLHTAEFMM